MHTGRFWFPINGDFVKLSVYHLERLDHVSGGPTEEGYSYTQRQFSYWNGVVTVKTYNNDCDCDGQIESWSTATADINSGYRLLHVDVPLLSWKRSNEHQRDHQAEAAGY